MIVWINGAFGSGKTQVSYELHRRIPGSMVFDPENAGYYIRKNIPRQLWKSDFQDYAMWREMNYAMLQELNGQYPGIIIVPMTVVNPVYFDEIVGRLRRDGVDVRHFTLGASRETIRNRLRSRGEGSRSWAALQTDRCVEGLQSEVFRHHLDTDNLTVRQAAEAIAAMLRIELRPDDRGLLRRTADRLWTMIRHIRFPE